jgi:hypothetical protein
MNLFLSLSSHVAMFRCDAATRCSISSRKQTNDNVPENKEQQETQIQSMIEIEIEMMK